MKILLFYPYFNQQQLMHSFISRLSEYEIEADVVCFNNLVIEKKSSVKWPNSVDCYFKLFGHRDSFGKSLKSKLTKKLRRLLDRYYLTRLLRLYDMVDFHAYILSYHFLMKECLKRNLKYDITLWGSDLMRATDERKTLLRYGLDHCYRIKMSDSLHEVMCQTYGKKYDEKSRIVYFGNSDLQIIDSLKESDIKKIVLKMYGDIGNKKIIVLGYNAVRSQNHEKMINVLNELTLDEKASIHVVLPMTYGSRSDYLSKIKKCVDNLKVSYTILDSFLEPEQVAALRMTANIVVNVQNTDAIAASLQDHLYCGNVCIFGEWLNYSPYTNNGIYYIKTRMEDIAMHVKEVLHNYSVYKDLCLGNKEKIRNLFSWEATIQKQISVYGE